YWLGSYSTRCMPGTVDGAGAYHCKPDLILVESIHGLNYLPSDSISWMSPKVITKYTGQTWKSSYCLQKTLHTKAYLVLLDQPWRQFVLGLSIVRQQMHVHFYDHSSCSISPLFNIDSNPKAFVAILAAVMFGPHQCIGFDPTLTVRPILPLWTITQNVLPAFILPPGMNANILFTSPTPNQLAGPTPNQTSTPNNPAGPVGVIQVHDMVYEIMEILFLSGRFLGQGTVVYCKRHKGWMYIIKDHWVENPSQERNMMKFLKGMPGVLSLIDH
ncbi:hypothetical protein PISMIDRAFT_104836, partial [Pisolithus microcarpus 441]